MREVVQVPAPAPEVIHGTDGVSIEDVTIDQRGAELTFVIALSDGRKLKRKATLPKGAKGRDGAFYVRNGIRQVNDLSYTSVTQNTDATATSGRFMYLVDASAGAVTITLPALGETGAAQSEYIVQKVDASPNAVYVASPSNVNGQASVGVVQQRSTMHVYWSDGGEGWVVG
ncbi:hypothetical protein [Sphingomonas sp.]|uniref:hypothetical protein n=1 Tax=Sphingomonas sp. TaxID=28214 RepID=UPI00356948C1